MRPHIGRKKKVGQLIHLVSYGLMRISGLRKLSPRMVTSVHPRSAPESPDERGCTIHLKGTP